VVASTKKDGLLTIGEVSRLSGVSVKTIRHYSDEGILPPSGITDSGYRLYSEEDRARLELIRTLRAAGFGLPTIKGLLRDELSTAEATRLQLEAVNLQLRVLGRQKALLEGGLNGGRALRSYLDRARALALLSAHEREAFLDEHFDRGMRSVPVDREWMEGFRKAAVLDLPEELTDEQLDAWVELGEIVSDEGFWERLRRQAKPFWEAAEGRFDPDEWRALWSETMQEAVAAVQEGRSPKGEREQRVVSRWVEVQARVMGRIGDPTFPAWLLSHYETTNEPRAERYWELIAVLKGCERPEGPSPQAEAYRWVLEGLRWRVSQNQRSDASNQLPSRVGPR
jgi:DNA-binding transcriptional MerR regulator